MFDNDDPGLCSGDGNVEAFCVICEASDPGCVRSDETHDHGVGLLSLCCVDGADLHLSFAILRESLREQCALASVWCEHQDAGWDPCVSFGHCTEQVLHCVCLHGIAGAAAVDAVLVSLAVNVDHAVSWVSFRQKHARVLGSGLPDATCPWPWDSQDFLWRLSEPAFEDAFVILGVGKSLNVRVHAVRTGSRA